MKRNLIALLMAVSLVAAACGGGGSDADEESCLTFAASSAAIADGVAEILDLGSETTDLVASGPPYTFEFGAAAFDLMEVRMKILRADLAALGPPPRKLSASTRLLDSAMEKHEDGLRMSAIGFRIVDADLLAEAGSALSEGAALMEDATAAIESCG